MPLQADTTFTTQSRAWEWLEGGYHYPNHGRLHRVIMAHYRARGVTSEAKLWELVHRWKRIKGLEITRQLGMQRKFRLSADGTSPWPCSLDEHAQAWRAVGAVRDEQYVN